jgi:hypothetical protein
MEIGNSVPEVKEVEEVKEVKDSEHLNRHTGDAWGAVPRNLLYLIYVLYFPSRSCSDALNDNLQRRKAAATSGA